MAGGFTELDLLTITPTWLKEKILEILSKDFDPNKNYEDNKKIYAVPSGYINNQGSGSNANLKLGDRTLAEAGCGVVACYNAIYYATNKKVPLYDIIKYCEEKGYIWSIPVDDKEIVAAYAMLELLDLLYQDEKDWVKEARKNLDLFVENKLNKAAGCGVTPNNIPDILQSKGGVSSKNYSSAKEFLSAVSSAVGKENKGFILVVWNGDHATDGAHYIFFRTYSDSDKISGYNDDPDITQNSTYQDVVDRLGQNNRQFYAGFEIQ